AETRREAPGLGEDPLLHRALLGGLGQRREFFVGDETRGQRSLGGLLPAHAGPDLEQVGIARRHGRLLRACRQRLWSAGVAAASSVARCRAPDRVRACALAVTT